MGQALNLSLNLLLDLQDVFKVLLGFFFALLAFNYQENYRERKTRRKNLYCFFMEISHNILSIITMQKDRCYRLLSTEYWYKVREEENLITPKDVFIYTIFLEELNELLALYLPLEKTALSASLTKTDIEEQAMKNIEKKLLEYLEFFQPIAEKAKETLKNKLIQMKILKTKNASKKQKIQ